MPPLGILSYYGGNLTHKSLTETELKVGTGGNEEMEQNRKDAESE